MNTGGLSAVERHLLVTNDFPPKVGGIQNYLWELWRRLPADSAVVHCTPYRHAVAFDAEQPFPIERSPEPVLIPYPWLPARIDRLADEIGAGLVLLDPALPLGLVGPALSHPYGVVLHGAEVTIPGRLPGSAALLRRVLRGATIVVSAGAYALAEAERCAGRTLPSLVIPPGVDHGAFEPADEDARAAGRARFELRAEDQVVAVTTRLVPRKGMHTLIEAAAMLAARQPDLRVLIGGRGREHRRLEGLIETTQAPVRLLGAVSDDDRRMLYEAADLMAMPCQSRWGGLEQEGFGIVFLEAAAMGLPQIAGRSGGAAEAVLDGETGLIVDRPDDPASVASAIEALLVDPERRRRMGRAARQRVVSDFDYQGLADRLADGLASVMTRPHDDIDSRDARRHEL